MVEDYLAFFRFQLFLGSGLRTDSSDYNLVYFLPIYLYLIDWAGKVVAQKKHNVVATSMGIYSIPIPLTSAFIPLSRIGIGIWWRMVLFNIRLNILFFRSIFYRMSWPIVGLSSLLVTIFLRILIVGWVTNRTIRKLSQKS